MSKKVPSHMEPYFTKNALPRFLNGEASLQSWLMETNLRSMDLLMTFATD
jgi:hypothetical protein